MAIKASKATKSLVRQRDKCCQYCGSKKNLQVHHIKQRSTHPHLANDVGNCILLCEECHKQVHRS